MWTRLRKESWQKLARWTKLFYYKVWHDDQDSFSINLGRRARFFNCKFCTTGQIIFSSNLTRRARFFSDKFGTTGKILLLKLETTGKILYQQIWGLHTYIQNLSFLYIDVIFFTVSISYVPFMQISNPVQCFMISVNLSI